MEKETKEPRRITGAPFYPMYFVSLSKTCNALGYALTVHGSMKRDLDLVDILWTDKAVDCDMLIKELLDGRDLKLMEGNNAEENTKKPHGRKAFVFVFFGSEECGYIDLSVMPLCPM